MNSEVRMREVEKWMNYARNDLRVAKMAYNDIDPVFNIACYLSQQCAEKSMKAMLIYLDIRFSYKHDLSYLLNLLPQKEQTIFADFDLDWLTDWVNEGRYPGNMPEATRSDARKAVEIAEDVYNLVKSYLP